MLCLTASFISSNDSRVRFSAPSLRHRRLAVGVVDRGRLRQPQLGRRRHTVHIVHSEHGANAAEHHDDQHRRHHDAPTPRPLRLRDLRLHHSGRRGVHRRSWAHGTVVNHTRLFPERASAQTCPRPPPWAGLPVLGRASVLGRVTLSTVEPGRLATSTRPPCAWATAVHDGQPETGAAGGPGPRACRRGRTARTRPAAGPPGCPGRRRPPSTRRYRRPARQADRSPWYRRGVCVRALASRFASTWCSRAASPGTVTGSSGRSSRQWCSGPGHVRVADRVDHQPRQVHRPGRQRPAGVQPGQQQQVLDQRGHPGRLRLHPAHRVRHIVRYPGIAAPRQLGVPADGGQRRAQFVAGVGDELADPGLAGLPGGQARRRRARASGSARRRPGRPRYAGRCPRPVPARTAPPRRGPAAARRPGRRWPRPGAAGAANAARSARRPARRAAARPARCRPRPGRDRSAWTPRRQRQAGDHHVAVGARRGDQPVVAEVADLPGARPAVGGQRGQDRIARPRAAASPGADVTIEAWSTEPSIRCACEGTGALARRSPGSSAARPAGGPSAVRNAAWRRPAAGRR